MHTLESSEGTLAFTATGRGPATAVLLVHGMPFDRTMWDDYVERIAQRRRVIAPDLPGFGASSGPPDSWSGYADALATLIVDRNLPPVVAVGFSVGGQIVLDLQQRYPTLVAGMALVDSAAGPDPDPAGRQALADRVLREGMDPYAVEVLYRMIRHDCSESTSERVLEMMRDADPIGVAAAHRLRANRPDHRPRLTGITVPTAVINGADDEFTPLADAFELARIPDAELTIVPRAAHMPPIEQPELFAAALDRLVTRLP